MIKICDMTSRNYFGKQNSTLGFVVPLAMFVFVRDVIVEKMFKSSKIYMIGGLGLAVKIDESMVGKYMSCKWM